MTIPSGKRSPLFVLLSALLAVHGCSAFHVCSSCVGAPGRYTVRPMWSRSGVSTSTTSSYRLMQRRRSIKVLIRSMVDSVKSFDAGQDGGDDDENGELVEPGRMRVAEIKAELDLRSIDYSDCFDKESLMERLAEARATGKANPNIIDKFNKQKLEETFKEEKIKVSDQDIEQAVANDGTLPGGMTPETFKKLTSNPEVMTLLQSTKVQEAMKLMMTGGREKLEEKLKDDPELQKSIEELNKVLRSVQ